jgi:CSLREA domain-containing protein
MNTIKGLIAVINSNIKQTHKHQRANYSIQPVILFALLSIVSFQLYAAPFTVNSTVDAVDLNPGDGICATSTGDCTLRAAIEESNALPGFPREIIELPTGSYVLSLGQLEIQNSLSLKGEGPYNSIIDADRRSTVLFIYGDASPIVSISGVTLRNGMGGSSISGAGIYIAGGATLTLTDSVVRDNETRAPGAGIANGGSLQLIRTSIRNNSLPLGTGGGVQFSGGGIMNFSSATLNINQSTISGNQATRGGGIRNAGGTLRITNSTISGNIANTRGGGIMNYGNASISFSTITNNEANAILGGAAEPAVGGGIYNTGNVYIGNTILAGNTDNHSRFDSNFSPDCFNGPPPADPSAPARFTSFRGNLVGILNANCDMRDTIYGDTRFDMVGTPDIPLYPRLQFLAYNDSSHIQTHALRSDSPAIDNGTGITSATFFDCPETDQRKLTRPVDGNNDGDAECDVGAYEYGAIPPQVVNEYFSLAENPTTSFSATPTPNGPAGTIL